MKETTRIARTVPTNIHLVRHSFPGLRFLKRTTETNLHVGGNCSPNTLPTCIDRLTQNKLRLHQPHCNSPSVERESRTLSRERPAKSTERPAPRAVRTLNTSHQIVNRKWNCNETGTREFRAAQSLQTRNRYTTVAIGAPADHRGQRTPKRSE